MRNDQQYSSPAYMDVGWQAGMSQRVFDTRVLPLFGFGLLMTATAAYLGRNLPFGLLIAAMIGELILVFTAGVWQRKELGSLNIGLYFLLTGLSGLTLIPLLQWANLRSGPMLIAQALAVTGITFGALMAYSLITKRDFSGWGGFLVAACIGLIIAMIVNVFIGGSTFSLIISCFGVVIFSGFVLYDMSVIKGQLSDADYIMAAIMLYLNFIGMFTHILRILGIMGSSDD
jgi:FtsH-binding integral membrane protein